MESPLPEMISPEAAEAAVSEAVPRYPDVTLPLAQCLGRALREPLKADRAQPPFHRVAMDGIALSFAAFQGGLRRFKVEGSRKAGEPAVRLASPEGCLEVMTGAVLPEGADCVVPVEEIAFEDGSAKLSDRVSLAAWKHVHQAGSDCAAGEIIVPEGVTLAPPHIGAAAAFGAMDLKVAYAPSVAVIGTGDELIEPSRRPAAHQHRRSNPYAIKAALEKRGIDRVALLHSRDEKLTLRRTIEGVLGKCDVLILTGGVSMGKTDYVPAVLKEVGIKPRFHKVTQKPGKPFWFGVGGAGMPVFALPGNPASVLVCLYRYVLPALQRGMSVETAVARAVLTQEAGPRGRLAHFRPVTVKLNPDGRFAASFVANQGSGDFSGWARGDGFVELPAGDEPLPQGSPVSFYPW